MHIGIPYNVKIVNAEVLTTEINIVENSEHTRYLANTYCIDEDTVFQKYKKERSMKNE